MNAKTGLSDFRLDVVLKKITESLTKTRKIKNKKTSITIICDVDDSDEVRGYKGTLNFLEKNKIIGQLETEESTGYLQDDDGWEREMHFYEPSFILNSKELTKFLVSTSRISKYSLRMGEADRKVVLNNKYILTKPHFSSLNYYFIEYVLKHPNEIVTKESLAKTAGKIDNLNKRFHTVLEQLNITPELRMIFFPHVSRDAAQFRNDVTMKDLIDTKINEKKLNDFLKTLKTI